MDRSPAPRFAVRRLISGGQTGVDRAALEFGRDAAIPLGGWCPKGRRSESGPIPEVFPLTETPSPSYPVRTRLNVRDSDATLIFTLGPPSGGTALTERLARSARKPVLIIDASDPSVNDAMDQVQHWLVRYHPAILNVAGPRRSEAPSLPDFVREVLAGVLSPPSPETPVTVWPPVRPFTPTLPGLDRENP